VSEHDREPERERDRDPDAERPRVKVTDKRRVRVEEPSAEGLGEDTSAGQSPPNPRSGALAEPAPSEDQPDLAEARRQAAEYREHLQRLQAEFDNYRKRVLKEQTRAVEMAAEPLVRRLLEVVDEFELALMAAEKRPDFDRFLHGVELVFAKLDDILRSEGLERIDARGKSFDPNLHEALMQSGEGDGEPVVGDVLRPGYTLKGRVIRPAGVRVVRK